MCYLVNFRYLIDVEMDPVRHRRGQLSKRRLLDVAGVVTLLRASKFYGQATKGARWMPWQKQAMKDAASCDKLRGAAHKR